MQPRLVDAVVLGPSARADSGGQFERALLLIGSVTGAQIGTRISMSVRPEYLRILLSAIVLLVAARMALGLGFRPDEIYTVEVR